MSEIGIIGIGNTLMGDDGAGVAVLEKLKDRVGDAEIVELATGGVNLVHELARFDRVILVDAGEFGAEPGRIAVFKPEDVQSVKTVGYSLHDWDIFTSIKLSREMGECPEKVILVAIQPERVDPVEGLTEAVSGKLDALADAVIAELAKMR